MIASVTQFTSGRGNIFRLVTLRRFLFVAAVGFWLGGFTFYSAVVIHVGARVLGSQLRQGLITQRVTDWLNLAGAIALAVMFWNLMTIWRSRPRPLRLLLAVTWLLMAIIQVELILLHPTMDRLLDPANRQVLDYSQFDRLHRIYLISSTMQWTVGLIHVWCEVAGEWT